MQLTLLKSKIHRATVTGASLDYEGSLAISADLAEFVGLVPHEKNSRWQLEQWPTIRDLCNLRRTAARTCRTQRRNRASRKNWRPHHDHEFRALHAGRSGRS